MLNACGLFYKNVYIPDSIDKVVQTPLGHIQTFPFE
jgi:hypothetical protein